MEELLRKSRASAAVDMPGQNLLSRGIHIPTQHIEQRVAHSENTFSFRFSVRQRNYLKRLLTD